MAELWMQVLPVTADGANLLERAMQPKVLTSGIAYNRYLLGLDPRNARAHTELGKSLFFLGQYDDAAAEFAESLKLREDAEPHYFLGLSHRLRNRLNDAANEFVAAIRIQPDHAKAYGNLGLVLIERGDLRGAEEALEKALQLNPEDELARTTLEELRAARKKQ
jgi:Flp pilus assembly protein TadD